MNIYLNNRYFLVGVSITILGLFFHQYAALENSIVREHDNLDSYFVYYHILADYGLALKTDPAYPIENVMNGIPRFCFPSGFNFINLWFYLFGSTTGYFINIFIIRITGFLGMFLLLKNHVFKNRENDFFITLTALSFAILPVFSIWGLSVMGQPLLLNSLLNIKKHKFNPSDWLVLCIFPLYSLLVFAGFFVLLYSGIWLLIDTIINKKVNFKFTGGVMLLLAMHIIVDYQLFYGALFSESFTAHRPNIYAARANDNFKGVLRITYNTLLNGWYHSASYFGILLYPVAVVALVIGFFKKQNIRPIFWIGTAAVSASALYSILHWKDLIALMEKVPGLTTFSLKRVHFLMPLLAYLAFAFGAELLGKIRMIRPALLILPLILIVMSFRMNYNFENGSINMDNFKVKSGKKGHSFAAYFDESLYNSISNYIGEPQESYRVIGVGISPSVLQFNGFYTLDSYQNLFSKEYYNHFVKINEKELAKTETSFANRCYIYSTDLAEGRDVITRLELHFELLLEIGGKYVISSKEIVATPQLKFIRQFNSEKFDNSVYLYRIIIPASDYPVEEHIKSETGNAADSL